MKRVGVVSFLGDAIELREQMFLPKPGKYDSAPFEIKSWMIDRYVRELVTSAMARQASMKIIAFDYDHQALWQANYDGPRVDSRFPRPVVLHDLAEIARRNDIDTLIVVYSPPAGFQGESYQLLPFCLFRSYGILGRNVDYHVYVWIAVIDGKSTDTLGFQALYHKESLDASFWPPYTEAGALTALEKKTKDVLGQRIPPMIKKLGF